MKKAVWIYVAVFCLIGCISCTSEPGATIPQPETSSSGPTTTRLSPTSPPLTPTASGNPNPAWNIPDLFIDQPIQSVVEGTLLYQSTVDLVDSGIQAEITHGSVTIPSPAISNVPEDYLVGVDSNQNLYFIQYKSQKITEQDAASEARPAALVQVSLTTGESRVLRLFASANACFIANNDRYVVWAEHAGTALNTGNYEIFIHSLESGRLASFTLPLADGSETSLFAGADSYVLHGGHLYYEVIDAVRGGRKTGASLWDYDIGNQSARLMARDACNPFLSGGEPAFVALGPNGEWLEAKTEDGNTLLVFDDMETSSNGWKAVLAGNYAVESGRFEESGSTIPPSLSEYKDEKGLHGAWLLLDSGNTKSPLAMCVRSGRITDLAATDHLVAASTTDPDTPVLLYDMAGNHLICTIEGERASGWFWFTDRGLVLSDVSPVENGTRYECTFVDIN